ncbi:MAG: HAD hydrolase-like protein [Bacteroidetes bacterium]|nr:HAD hydrolase-like protein [Bacteroidota bacterium]MBU1372625.1 HAD hydrolase-like protein [Bacteroidota bacterium]MBU1484821.1 HAD hydrolase-like protein [Bacteroidota bacterium]MBU1760866.1 HAD hydrolase-like protein [Bacteroidota bacterium]MBU2377514.1 HAD hydrolase-like protein [Bacteroidota bacterium]
MSDIKLVVLDMAGTTLKDDQNVAQAFHEAMKIQGYDIPFQKINPLMGFKKTEAIMMMLKEYETESERITTTLIDIIHEDFIEIMIEFYEHSSDICALPGVEETMEIIKSKGIKIGVDTGFSKQVAELIVKRLGWREKGLIDVLVGSDEVEKGRPYPYMIEKMMAELSIEKGSGIAKVGDTEVDVQEGFNAGCKYVIGITTGAYTRAELEKAKPTHIVDSFKEILPIILS